MQRKLRLLGLLWIPTAEDCSETWDHVLELLPASVQQGLVLCKGMHFSLGVELLLGHTLPVLKTIWVWQVSVVGWFFVCLFVLIEYDEAVLMLIPDRSAEHSNEWFFFFFPYQNISMPNLNLCDSNMFVFFFFKLNWFFNFCPFYFCDR